LREFNLEELARGQGVSSKPYLEFLRLQAAFYNLNDLNESLKDACAIIPSKDRRKGVPPEMQLYEFILKQKERIETLEGKSNNKIGCE
jgi:hypothetical protein